MADVEDLSVGAAEVLPRAPVQVPKLPALAVAVVLAAGVVAALALRGHAAAERRAEADVRVAVVSATRAEGPPSSLPEVVDVDVIVQLRTSVPVTVLDAELDGAPPVSRGNPTTPSRTPTADVRWDVLCAEVGSVPGPRLLDVTLRTASSLQHRRLRLSTSDDDPIARTFRLAAAVDCG